ncbi:hypothetical protein GCM10010521_15900 [Streptomyces rameus]|uniref:Uncharacterized protein n=1 Tax=Streptomyces rameus TaxID=68261 RepID=A0ABP6MYN8_9ACTN
MTTSPPGAAPAPRRSPRPYAPPTTPFSAYLDDGTTTLVPLPVRKLERRASAHTHRWYHLLTILCPRGPHEHREPVGVTTTPGERDEGQSDTETGFHRAGHLLQIPDNTAAHQHLYGGREDTEAGFSQFDRSLWNRRMIAFGAEAQSLAVRGFLLAQNATSAARYEETPPTPTQTLGPETSATATRGHADHEPG